MLVENLAKSAKVAPSQGRELKPLERADSKDRGEVAPSQGRELKQFFRGLTGRIETVAPSQGRELKPVILKTPHTCGVSPLHRGVN